VNTIVPIMRLEVLPEIGTSSGIYLQRVRIFFNYGTNNKVSVLGAGISLSKELSLAKARSEALERLTLHPQTKSLREDIPIQIRGTTGLPLICPRVRSSYLDAAMFTSAAACHFTRQRALRETLIEVIEREQLQSWCRGCETSDEVCVAIIDLTVDYIPNALRNYLINMPFKFVLSWCKNQLPIPFFVCIAIHSSGKYFYAASASSNSVREALEKVLLDCAKMFLFEEYSENRGIPIQFRHPTRILPQVFRRKIKSILGVVDWNSLEGYRLWDKYSVDYSGFEHRAPWTIKMDCYAFSAFTKQVTDVTPLIRCFR